MYMSEPKGICSDGYKFNPNTGTCVGLQSVTGSWDEAKAYCENKGEYLLTLHTIQDGEWLEVQRNTFPGLIIHSECLMNGNPLHIN